MRLTSAIVSFQPSVFPHATILLPVDEFSWNFVLEDFSKIYRKNQISWNSDLSLDTSCCYEGEGRTALQFFLHPHKVSILTRSQHAAYECSWRWTTEARNMLSCWMLWIKSSNIVYLVGLHIYCKMIHGPNSIKLTGIINNIFKPQETLKKTIIKLYNLLVHSSFVIS